MGGAHWMGEMVQKQGKGGLPRRKLRPVIGLEDAFRRATG